MSSKTSAALATKATAPAEQANATNNGLPLFYQQPAALEKNRHAKAGVLTAPNYSFAKATNSLTLNVLEFLEASKYYPIVFTAGDAPVPLAVVGLEKDNYFVGGDTLWREGTYIPAYVRQYPFIFFENEEEKKFYLCIDEKSTHYREKGDAGSEALFNADGTPSPLSNNALEFCTAYYQQHAITKEFTADLVKHKLLSPYQSSVTLKTGRQISFSGFNMIDETAFNALPDEAILEFRKKGWLAFIYLALASTSNWNRLLGLANAAEA